MKVGKADLDKQFERECGEKRRVQIIMWPKGDDTKAIQGFAREAYMQRKMEERARDLSHAYNVAIRVSGGYKEVTSVITGVAAALLLSLVLVGRVIVISAELNAALDDRSHAGKTG